MVDTIIDKLDDTIGAGPAPESAACSVAAGCEELADAALTECPAYRSTACTVTTSVAAGKPVSPEEYPLVLWMGVQDPDPDSDCTVVLLLQLNQWQLLFLRVVDDSSLGELHALRVIPLRVCVPSP